MAPEATDKQETFCLPFDGELLPGVLLRRYKRFLVDVRLGDGSQVTAHTPNTGSMMGCSEPGSPVYLSRSDNPRRKLPFTLELVDTGESLVGINTQLPNRFFAQAAAGGHLARLSGYSEVRREVKVSQGSRLDLALKHPDRPTCYVEIKNVTLIREGVARFPDARTERGRKHLRELATLAERGDRAVILFAVQRTDCAAMGPADDIDPEYGAELRRVVAAGVEALAYQLRATVEGIYLEGRLPVLL